VATIVAIAYPNQGTAEQAQAPVFRLDDELVIRASQVAVIWRDPDGTFHVHTSHDCIPTAGGAIWGGFWGLLLGTLFLIPLAGWAIGAGVGARLGYPKEKGVGEDFQQQVRDHLEPDKSLASLPAWFRRWGVAPGSSPAADEPHPPIRMMPHGRLDLDSPLHGEDPHIRPSSSRRCHGTATR
jgi:uncharacterized membrane protein